MMRRVPLSIQGLFFAPVLICLFFVLKAFCPDSAGSGCFADQFAVPIFLPLVAVYKIFGSSDVIGGHEFIFISAYWAIIGFLIGLMFDLWMRKGVPHREITEADFHTHFPSTASATQPIVPINTPMARPVVPPMPAVPKPKPPINLLDRKEEDMPR
jgi:hypothetical protein